MADGLAKLCDTPKVSSDFRSISVVRNRRVLQGSRHFQLANAVRHVIVKQCREYCARIMRVLIKKVFAFAPELFSTLASAKEWPVKGNVAKQVEHVRIMTIGGIG